MPTVYSYVATVENPWTLAELDLTEAAITIFKSVYPRHLHSFASIMNKGAVGGLNVSTFFRCSSDTHLRRTGLKLQQRVYEWRRGFGLAAKRVVDEYMESESNWDDEEVPITVQRSEYVAWGLDIDAKTVVKLPFRYAFIDDDGVSCTVSQSLDSSSALLAHRDFRLRVPPMKRR